MWRVRLEDELTSANLRCEHPHTFRGLYYSEVHDSSSLAGKARAIGPIARSKAAARGVRGSGYNKVGAKSMQGKRSESLNLEDLDLLPAEEGDLSSLAAANILSSDAPLAEPDLYLPLSLPAIPPVSTGQSADMPLLEQLDWLQFEPMSEHVPAPPHLPLQQAQPQSSLRPSLSLLQATVQQANLMSQSQPSSLGLRRHSFAPVVETTGTVAREEEPLPTLKSSSSAAAGSGHQLRPRRHSSSLGTHYEAAVSKRRTRKPSAKASDSGASGSAGGNSLRGYYMRERQKQQVKQLEAAATQETELSQPRSSGNYSGSGSESLGRLYPRPASAPSLASERLEESREGQQGLQQPGFFSRLSRRDTDVTSGAGFSGPATSVIDIPLPSMSRRTAAFPTASMQWSVALPPMALKSPFSDSPREGSASPAATQQQWVAEYQRQARELQANTVRLTQERQRLSEGTSQLQEKADVLSELVEDLEKLGADEAAKEERLQAGSLQLRQLQTASSQPPRTSGFEPGQGGSQAPGSSAGP